MHRSYGATIGQLIFYVRAFPCDRLLVKILVLVVFILDSTHTYLSASVTYRVFILCRMDASPSCSCLLSLSRELTMGAFVVCGITFMVQVFYAHRVWIISGQNRVLTFLVIALTTTQFLLGLMVVVEILRTPTFETLSSSRYMALSAVASAICDAMITSSVFYYLRPERTGITRRPNIKRLNLVFVQMGSLSFMNALTVVVLCYMQDQVLGQFLIAAPSLIATKTYVNSMLAVLNERKYIRDQQLDRLTTMELPTIPTIY
ncbi:hypothetical protein BS17DRAFT_787358 [Gyrodon lividus]|nr:hypothetical protein BS17DRAFT_787358 [Gyrodon lividus]